VSPEVFAPILLEAHNPSPMTGRGNNTYLVPSDDGSAVLIDAGVGRAQHIEEIAAALSDRALSLTSVVVTHGHSDHASGAPALAKRFPGAVFVKYPGLDDRRLAVAWKTVGEGDRVGVGEHALVVLRTPGHAADHIALWHEPSRSAFIGDLVVANGSVMIAGNRGGNLAEYLASLERVRALDARVLFPAHGPRIEDPHAVLTAYLKHREERERQILAALAAGRSTVQEITKSIYDHLGLPSELMAAAQETVLAHLEKLKDEERITSEEHRWKI
jgi:glyoxylase-like metal-dependent hydrolase (beta-lactamase superfamily II)